MSRHVLIGWIVILFAFAAAMPARGQALAIPQEADYIGGITEDTIGLEDHDYRFAPDVKFYSENGQIISKSDFKVGEYVGYALNADNEVVSVWKLKKNPFTE